MRRGIDWLVVDGNVDGDPFLARIVGVLVNMQDRGAICNLEGELGE